MTIEKCEKHDCDFTVPVAFSSLLSTDSPFLKPYCRECLDENIEAERVQRLAEDEERRIERVAEYERTKYQHLQIGARFEKVTFEEYVTTTTEQKIVKETCHRYCQTFKDRLDGGDGLILLGNPGTGKNHLAAAIAKGVFDQRFSVLHTTAVKVMREIKETWSRECPTTEREAIDKFTSPDLLIIDEVGVQFGSNTEQILFMDVINSRYSNLKPTILLSMFDIDTLTKVIGGQIIDRFREGKSSILHLTWESHRKPAGK